MNDAFKTLENVRRVIEELAMKEEKVVLVKSYISDVTKKDIYKYII
jgi:enamine deaminase RidA (YjgF/YER057c/UK114 family)